MTPDGPPASSLPRKKTGPTAAGVATFGVVIIGIVVALVEIFTRGSPQAVTTALHGEKRDYVGRWETKDGTPSADLAIDVTGDLSYNESSALRKSRGRHDGNYEADDQYITGFEGDDIVVGRSLRINVTSRPHVVGDHVEMTVNAMHELGAIGDVSFVRER